MYCFFAHRRLLFDLIGGFHHFFDRFLLMFDDNQCNNPCHTHEQGVKRQRRTAEKNLIIRSEKFENKPRATKHNEHQRISFCCRHIMILFCTNQKNDNNSDCSQSLDRLSRKQCRSCVHVVNTDWKRIPHLLVRHYYRCGAFAGHGLRV